MGFFWKKKQDKASKIDEAFDRVYKKMDSIDSWDDPKKLEHYILDSCEQIIATTKEIERQKAEYRIVTAYLNDIKAIENAPKDIATELRDSASRIVELNLSIANISNIHRNISEDQIALISENEDEMPAIINRMAEQERYQESIKKEMNSIEAEKSRFEMEREEIADSRKIIKNLSLASLVVFASLMVLFWVISISSDFDLQLAFVILLMIAAVSGFVIYIRQSDLKRNNMKALNYLNQSINMLNVIRMKYVNVTNGLEYTKDKFPVQSAAELMYVWEQYMESVKDKQRFSKTNDDLDYYTSRLMRTLSQIDIHDRRIWMTQTKALINRDDMIEVRHKLVARRQKIRTNMEENRQFVWRERNEIDRLMTEHRHYLPEIQEIIKSVDKLCGLKKS